MHVYGYVQICILCMPVYICVFVHICMHINLCIYICNQYMYYITKNLKQLPNVNCDLELENTQGC